MLAFIGCASLSQALATTSDFVLAYAMPRSGHSSSVAPLLRSPGETVQDQRCPASCLAMSSVECPERSLFQAPRDKLTRFCNSSVFAAARLCLRPFPAQRRAQIKCKQSRPSSPGWRTHRLVVEGEALQGLQGVRRRGHLHSLSQVAKDKKWRMAGKKLRALLFTCFFGLRLPVYPACAWFNVPDDTPMLPVW